MILTKVTKNKPDKVNILYVVLFELEGKSLVKIGVTSRNIEDRVSEILVSIFKKYRMFPYCRPKRFKKTAMAYEKEAVLHEYFKEYSYKTENKFSGSTEFFDVPLELVVNAYEELLNNGSVKS